MKPKPKHYIDGLGILAFSMLLYSGMWVSKTIHPLWFDHKDALEYFGISYAVMAAAGASSFLLGRLISKVPLRLAMFAGCLLYTVGMGLRIFPTLPFAILSGLVAGIGASTALICLSSWPFERSDDEQRNRLFGYSLLSSNLARGVVVTAAGVLFFLPGVSVDFHQTLLLFAAALPVVAFVFCYPTIPTFKAPSLNVNSPATAERVKRNEVLPLLALYSGVSGITVSFVLPYLPVFLVDKGLSEGTTIIILGLCSVVVVLTQPIISQMASQRNMQNAYIVSILSLAVSTALLAWDGWVVVFVLWIGIRFIAANSVMYTQRALEMQMIDKDKVQRGMGLLQSAFLLGDMLGAGVSGFLWALGFGRVILPVLGCIILANGLFFLWLVRRAAPLQRVPSRA